MALGARHAAGICSVISAFTLAFVVVTGCSKPQTAMKVPVRLCVPNPFSANKSKPESPAGLGIVNGVVAGNSDPLERTVVGILMQYTLSDGNSSAGICTGVVAGKDVVLSAAHCFQPPANATSRKVYITFNEELRNLDASDVIEAERVIMHPDYTGNRANYSNADIAVLKLTRSVPSSQLVASFVRDPGSLAAGSGITAIGYGVTGTSNRDSGLKRRADSSVANLINAANYPGSPLRDQIRIVDTSGSTRGACFGDSGGPGFVRGKANVFGVVQGVHITVQGPGPSCEKADYNYTLVAPFMGWIEQQIGYKLNVSGDPQSVAQSPAWGGMGGSTPSASSEPDASEPRDTDVFTPEGGDTDGKTSSPKVAVSSKRRSSNQSVLPYCK